jgi:hypothetical protein
MGDPDTACQRDPVKQTLEVGILSCATPHTELSLINGCDTG